METNIPSTLSIRTIFDDLPKMCRFCFCRMLENVPSIDVFATKIDNETLLDVVMNYFAVVEETSYEQYLNGRVWTTEHLEVTNFQLNNVDHGLCCICIDCLQVIIESKWFANHLRLQNLKLMGTASLCTMLSNCTLSGLEGNCAIPIETIMPSWTYEKRNKPNELCNFSDVCIFCFHHNTPFLFDVFLSNIMGTNVVDVIKICSTTYKKEDIYEKIHLVKSLTKQITVVDFQWNIEEKRKVPRKICLNCMLPLIKLKALMERIRKTNEAVPFLGLTSKLDGSIEINIPYSSLDEIVSQCDFMTNEFGRIPTNQILEVINGTQSTGKRNDHPSEFNELILGITAAPKQTVFKLPCVEHAPAIMPSVYCEYCQKEIHGCFSVEEHILKCLQEDVVFGVEIHNRGLCENCLSVVFKKEETLLAKPMEAFKKCSICKLWLYMTRDPLDLDLDFTTFIEKYFM